MANINADEVHETLGKYMLADGYDLVYDPEESHGTYFVDKKSGKEYLDFFTFFASLPIGHNHPKLMEKSFLDRLTRAALNKPSNSDIYTTEMAEFVDTFARVAMPDEMKHLFFICGGALAVENALKVSMDWKVRKNFAKGSTEERGTQVIHFKHAFHGRSGYTLSLTNTFDPRKYQYFARFDWPRIDTPKLTFPITEEVERRVELEEKESIHQIHNAVERCGDDICGLIIEPIQGEGGDVHFRPEFMRSLRKICDENELMLIYDEVQSGMGITGKMWAYQHYDTPPDIFAFGKKSQVCGIAANGRLSEVDDNCFQESSRINSTWGGNLVDMVRSQRYLEIIEEDKLVRNAHKVGSYLKDQLKAFQNTHTTVTNVRGKGLMVAFDLPSTEKRDEVFRSTYENGLLVLKSGERAIRFRPPLNVTKEEIDTAMEILDDAMKN